MVEFINYWIGSAMDFAPSSGFSLTSNPHQPSLPLFPMDRNTFPLTKMLAIDKRLLRIATASCLVMASATLMQASDWTGNTGAGTWSSTGNPGWNGGVPNAEGAQANFFAKTGTQTISLDGSYTVGSITLSPDTGGAQVTIQPSAANILTFNNTGTSGATITNNTTTTSGLLQIGSSGTGGKVTLADNLAFINNNSNMTGTNIAIRFYSVIDGTGGVTFSNVNNSLSVGQISLIATSNNTFTGNVLVEKGAVIFSSGSSSTNVFGNTSNTITLGSLGKGAASLVGTNANTGFEVKNNIIVTAGSGGTLLLGASTNGNGTATFSGTVTLNGDVTLLSNKITTSDTRFTKAIGGNGGVTTSGTGLIRFGDGTNVVTETYKGSTILSEASSLALSDNAQMTFYIGNSGVNNKITATGIQNVLTLDGDFVFDLTGAAANGTWQIVDVSLLSETFSSSFRVFSTSSVNPWAENSNVWTYVNGGVTYSFSEATGVLTAVPEPTTALLLGGGLMVLLLRRRRK